MSDDIFGRVMVPSEEAGSVVVFAEDVPNDGQRQEGVESAARAAVVLVRQCAQPGDDESMRPSRYFKLPSRCFKLMECLPRPAL
jgi:hypothetical protein